MKIMLIKFRLRTRGVHLHSKSLCESKNIGKGTRVWAFVHILPEAVIGMDCNICDSVFIENKVRIGNRVTIKSGVQIWDGIEIGDDVFIGPNVTFTNDKYPKSRKWQQNVLKTKIEHGASLGANSTILPGVTIGSNAVVGAGSVVTKNVQANSVVIGNPAHLIRDNYGQ